MTGSSLGSIVEASLDQVWNQRDPVKRMAALEQLYQPDAILFEAEREVRGVAAISMAVDAVLADLPPDFRFVPLGTAAGHHGIAIARWAGRSGDAVLVTGHDVAAIAEGRIAMLHVFLDPA